MLCMEYCSFMLNAIQEVMLHDHCYTWSEALCQLISAILGGKHFLIVTHGVRHYAHSFTWSENLCLFLYKV